MRELIYLSTMKLNRMFVDGRPKRRLSGASASVGLSEVTVTAGLSFDTSAATTQAPADGEAEKLEEVIRLLDRTHQPARFPSQKLMPAQWITFDLPMGYATMHEDAGCGPDDIALFAARVNAADAGQARDVGLMLCGTVDHLRDRVASAGRMGSGTGWLYDLIITLRQRDCAGLLNLPESLTEMVSAHRSDTMAEQVALWVFGILEDYRPRQQYGRLRGHARVLMDIDGEGWLDRLVLATPLYIEIAPQQLSPRRWHDRLRIRRRQA